MDKDKIRNGVRKYNEVNDNLRKKLETYDRLQEERKEAFNNNKHVKRFKKVNDFIFKYVTIFTLGAMSPVFFGFLHLYKTDGSLVLRSFVILHFFSTIGIILY